MTGTGLCFLPWFPLDHVTNSQKLDSTFQPVSLGSVIWRIEFQSIVGTSSILSFRPSGLSQLSPFDVLYRLSHLAPTGRLGVLYNPTGHLPRTG